MYCRFFGRYYYNATYPGAFFYGSHKFPYRSLLLSTTVLNDYMHDLCKIPPHRYITHASTSTALWPIILISMYTDTSMSLYNATTV